MSVIASSRAERWLFPGWVAFAAINTAVMYVVPGEETVPFHFVWISLALVYGLQPWSMARTLLVLVLVCGLTGLALLIHVQNDVIGWEETTEVPLMTAVFLATVWHVRRRMAAERAARQLADSEHRMRDSQRRFVRFASHELRTPVTVARGYTELLREAAIVPQVREDAAIVLDELDKLERIAARLLMLAQVDERPSLAPRPTDLDRLLERTAQRWRAAAPRVWSVDAQAGVVAADPERLTTALDTMLDNAVRHTGDGGRIELRARRAGDAAVVEVRDDGVGISPDELDYVFESFRSGRAGGTGIGLAIVKAVVEAHDGTVSVASAPHDGTVFTLSWPAAGRSNYPAAADEPLAVGRDALATTVDPRP
jgi:two-component system OmpR family sensor kinase